MVNLGIFVEYMCVCVCVKNLAEKSVIGYRNFGKTA